MKRSELPTAPGKPGYLIYEDTPRWDWWLKVILGGALAATIIPGIVLTFNGGADGPGMLGVTAVQALVFYFVMPRRYQLFDNRVRIVLGWPFGLDISLSNIKDIRVATASKALVNWGIQFATSSRTAIEIVRKKGWSVTISPSDRDAFVQRLNEALKTVPSLP